MKAIRVCVWKESTHTTRVWRDVEVEAAAHWLRIYETGKPVVWVPREHVEFIEADEEAAF